MERIYIDASIYGGLIARHLSLNVLTSLREVWIMELWMQQDQYEMEALGTLICGTRGQGIISSHLGITSYLLELASHESSGDE